MVERLVAMFSHCSRAGCYSLVCIVTKTYCQNECAWCQSNPTFQTLQYVQIKRVSEMLRMIRKEPQLVLIAAVGSGHVHVRIGHVLAVN